MGKSRIVLILLSIFLGLLGIDRFYAGRPFLGILKLLTGGVLGIMWLSDIFLSVFGLMRDQNGERI